MVCGGTALPNELLEGLEDEPSGFEAVAAGAWVRYDDPDEIGKSACNRPEVMPAACRDLIATLSGPTAAKLCSFIGDSTPACADAL